MRAAKGWRPVLLLVGAVLAARLAYAALVCPYALVEDEAHYWEWSRRPDWSYYSKGPGVAWAIAASTALFGETEFGVRFPAIISGAVAALAVAGLARDASGRARAGLFAAACVLLIPILQITGLLMTIDGPYLAAWALAAWAAWHAAERGRTWAWPAAAGALAAGFLFKYTVVLLIPGLLLYLWSRPAGRAPPPAAPRIHPIAAVAAAILALALAPVVIWNAEHGWPTLRHLAGHVGLAWSDVPPKDLPDERFNPLWTLEFLGIQIAIMGPAIGLMVMGSLRAVRERASDPGPFFLICLAVPVLGFYLLLSPFTQVEGNWALGGYVTLAALAGITIARGLDTPGQSGARVRALWRATLVVGIAVAAIAARLDLIAASAPARALDARLGRADRPLIPAGKLMAAPAMAADAARLVGALRQRTGLEPFVVAEHYGRASLMAFYIPGRPVVYCSSSMLGEGRRTQYDYWPDTDLGDLQTLGGRPALCLGKWRERWEQAFSGVEELGRLAGEPKRDRLAFYGFGYTGFRAD